MATAEIVIPRSTIFWITALDGIAGSPSEITIMCFRCAGAFSSAFTPALTQSCRLGMSIGFALSSAAVIASGLTRASGTIQFTPLPGVALHLPEKSTAPKRSFFPMERTTRSEEHTSELQSQSNLVCRLLLEKKKKEKTTPRNQHQ